MRTLETWVVIGLLAFGLGCPEDETMPPTGEGDTGDGDGDSMDESETGDACLGPDGCFACEPTSSIEIINACTDAACETFENTPERLPLLETDGTLPPIP